MTVENSVAVLAKTARETGLLGILNRPESTGLASMAAIRITGKDAASFLHAQLTNDVQALQPGEGNLTARTTRTGHLLYILSLRRLPTDIGQAPAYLCWLDENACHGFLEAVEEFLFADDVDFEIVTSDYQWLLIQGPKCRELLESVMGSVPPLGINSVRETGSEATPAGTMLFSQAAYGDESLMLAFPSAEKSIDSLIARLKKRAEEMGFATPSNPQLGQVLEVHRIEAGIVRVGNDTPGRQRLLPETCLESQVVSYTKGCFLGQEVIARIRTYGSLPYELRGMFFEGTDVGCEDLPAAGEPVQQEDGKSIGQWLSRTRSLTLNGTLALVYLDKAHRTPDKILHVRGREKPIRAKVVLVPFYSGAQHLKEARPIYEEAIRQFAEGNEDMALALLEKALTIDPKLADAYEAVGVILGRAERFEEAISIFQRLESIAPHEAMVNTNLSLFYMKLGDKETAESHSAMAARKSQPRPVGSGALSSRMKIVEDAPQAAEAKKKKEMFSRVLEIDPGDPIALFGLGNACATLNDWHEANGWYSKAIRAQATNSAIYLARGKALEKLERDDEAITIYEAGLEVASRKGDLAPLREMQTRLLLLSG